MFKRLFLAGTITFPLYIIIAIQQAPPVADGIAHIPDKPERAIEKIGQKIQNFRQELQRSRSTTIESERSLDPSKK